MAAALRTENSVQEMARKCLEMRGMVEFAKRLPQEKDFRHAVSIAGELIRHGKERLL